MAFRIECGSSETRMLRRKNFWADNEKRTGRLLTVSVDKTLLLNLLGWLMGLEPTTTGITILDSTN